MTIIQTETDARDNDIRGHGEGVKHIRHPVLGPIAFEYSVFARSSLQSHLRRRRRGKNPVRAHRDEKSQISQRCKRAPAQHNRGDSIPTLQPPHSESKVDATS